MKNTKILSVFTGALFFLLLDSVPIVASEKISLSQPQEEQSFQYLINKAKNGVPFTIADYQVDENKLRQFQASSEDEDYWIYTILKLEKTNLFPALMRRAVEKEPKSPLAQYNLGYMYLYGIRMPQNPERAMNLMIPAAAEGSAPAQHHMGLRYHEIQNLPLALEWYQKAANQGFAEAQYILSFHYARGGDGVEKDRPLAFKWLERAAYHGHYRAQGKLGCLYEQGIDVEKNDQEAIYWYKEGAEGGDALAQCNLGHHYQTGLGVPQDNQLAFKWIQKSVHQGSTLGNYYLGLLYLEGKGVEKDDKRAVEWFEKAAVQGHPAAQSTLGQMYQQGRGVAQDNVQAAIWYEKAAEKGDAFAQNNIGMMYQEGRFVSKDEEKSLKWIRASAGQKHSPALFNLGVVYLMGRGVENSPTRALNLFIESLTKGDLSENDATLVRSVLKMHFKKFAQEVPNLNFQESEELLNNFKTLNKNMQTDFEFLNFFKKEGFMVSCLQPLKEELKKELEIGSALKSYRYQNLYFLTFGEENVKQADKLINLLQTDSEEADLKNQWSRQLTEGRYQRNQRFLTKHPYFED